MRKLTVTFQPQGIVSSVPFGSTILEAALSAGVWITSDCAGSGTCGKCRIQLLDGPCSSLSPEETQLIPEEQLKDNFRLACRCLPLDDIVVKVPEAAFALREHFLEEGEAAYFPLQPNVRSLELTLPPPSLSDQRSDYERLRAALTGSGLSPAAPLSLLQQLPDALRSSSFRLRVVLAGDEILDLLPPGQNHPLCGVAFDIGTTSVVGYLFDLSSGRRLSVASTLNPQAQYGSDVIARMGLASSDEGLSLLHTEIISCLNQLLKTLTASAQLRSHHIYEATVVGNPCMLHLLLGIRPSNIAFTPFVSAFTHPLSLTASSVGLLLHPRAKLHLLPAVAGYVGADIVAGVVATGLDQPGPPRLFIDIGTNGEVVLAAKGTLLACSTAAGPAFEGGEITFGMRAAPGAIDHVSVNSEVHCTTVDGAQPIGICGSGLLEAVAELVKKRIISPNGRLLPPHVLPQLPVSLLSRLTPYNSEPGFLLSPADNGPVFLTQSDIRQVQLAKAAIAAGASLLLEQAGLEPDDLDAVLLAGAFGAFITKDSTLALGLLPTVSPAKIHSVGNAAGSGASLALLSLKARNLADQVANSIQYLELSSHVPFQNRFVEAMNFPSPSEELT